MPLPVIAAVALGVGSMISQNVQNKAANKNNLNQQNEAVQNSRAAYQNAQKQMAALIANNPSPFAGQSIAGPSAIGAGAARNYGAPGGTAASGIAGQVLGGAPAAKSAAPIAAAATPGGMTGAPAMAKPLTGPVQAAGQPAARTAVNPILAKLIMQGMGQAA